MITNKMMNNWRLCLGGVGLAAFCISTPVLAQESGEQKNARPVIEEVIVSAQKRQEGIRDVPISMMALDAEFLSEKGITDFSELSNFVPNVKMRTDVGSGANMNIRGFSKQAGNVAFDQSVGLLIDGVPYNDNDFFLIGLVDLARIEILRGPQGTLLGKNTTAGMVNITTNRPTDEFSAYADLQSGTYNQKRIEAAVGGPIITDALNFRLAGLSDKREGVFKNTTAIVGEDPRSFFPGVPEKELDRDREAFRIKLEAPNFMGSVLGLQYERADLSATGNGTEILSIDQDTEDYLRQFDPNLDVEPGNYRGSENDPAYSERVVEKVVLSWEKSFGEWNMNVAAGKANVSGLIEGGDPTPAPLFGFLFLTDKPQVNFDAVLTSPLLFSDKVDFTIGTFYEKRDLSVDMNVRLNTEPFAAIIVAANSDTSVVLPASLITSPLPLNDALQEESTVYFDQEAETKALYGQLNWYFSDRWELTLGLRVSNEDKAADIRRVFDSQNTAITTTTLGYEEFDISLSRSETTTQPKIALNFKPTDDISLFLHWARGFRGGGYNSGPGRSTGIEYDKEVVDEYAFNAKMRLLDGSMNLNFGLYRMELRDFQLLTTGPNDLAAVTTNAGEAQTQGMEADLMWLPTNWLAVTTAVGYNDSTFIEFPFGPCAADNADSDGDGDERCDLKGERLPNAPEWSAALSLNARVPFSRLPILNNLGDLELLAGVNAEYQTEATTGLPGDDRFTQAEYTRYGANLGVASPGDGWTLRLTVKNITDEVVNRVILPIPTTANLVQNVEPPRTAYVQFRWEY